MTDKVSKFIDSLDAKIKERLKQKLIRLRQNPFAMTGVKKLVNWGKATYRLRIGKIRIIYTVIDGNIEIIDIDYRGNIY
ncbi:MAG: type II toxin-antitoxin system RelE/ParE family toxin [Patescibacteria group bacterium]